MHRLLSARRARVIVAVFMVASCASVGLLPPPAGLAAHADVPIIGQGYWLAGADGSVYPFGSVTPLGSLSGTALKSPVAGLASTPTGDGYWLVASDGGIFNFGNAAFYGSTGDIHLNRPIVGMAAAPSGHGYWLVASDGGIFNFGDAAFYGSVGGQPLNRPIVGMAATPSGHGYWFVASDGGIFNFGDAAFYGSTGDIRLNQPIVGMTPTPTGHGYWLVASDGGVFSFGDAAFYGSMGDPQLNQPIVGMTPTPTGHGYWLVASDGGVFSFGDAGFYGSTGDIRLNRPIVGMTPTTTGHGYWFVASDGGIFNFGDAAFQGSVGDRALPRPVIAMGAPRPAGALILSGPTPNPVKPTTTGPPASNTTPANAGAGPRPGAFDIGLVGDTGYSARMDEQFERVIYDMNRHSLAFVIHDGDIKDPASPCADARYLKVRGWFNRVEWPVVYTPGDNEWMDCDDPVGRLAFLRNTFFPADESLGEHRLPLTTQRAQGYPENARWVMGGVVFTTLDVPGPNDNIPNPDESGPRRMANLQWLDAAFDTAEATNAPAVLIDWQADPFTGMFDHIFSYLMDELRRRTIEFGRPVVLVHGDTHTYRIDHPWPDVPTFTRVETHALVDPTNWIRATVDPADPKVFTFHDELAR